MNEMTLPDRLMARSPCKEGGGVNIYLEAAQKIEQLERELKATVDKAAFTAGWVASKSWGGIAPTKEGEQTRIDYDYKMWRALVSEGQRDIGQEILDSIKELKRDLAG